MQPDRPDRVEKLGNSLVQHGPANSRVYLMKLDEGDMPGIVTRMESLADLHGYSKLFARVPSRAEAWFTARGFRSEARVPGLYRGRASGCFMGKYLSRERSLPRNPQRLEEVRRLAQDKARPTPPRVDTAGVEQLGPEQAKALASLYAEVFASYPFPITDPAFLAESMAGKTAFYGIRQEGRLVAASSAEMDERWACAEMTDFATLPACRGQGAAGRLLARMEQDMRGRGFATAYTIARAESAGMNAVFARAGYELAGTLPNNTQICGRLESMNVWYKALAED